MSERGRVFKVETLGAVDGPGLRYVLFLQGCPLRCPYCHNPEGWAAQGGWETDAGAVLAQLRRYLPYYKGGGLTVSGGEPLLQAGFVRELFARCRAEGIHTALDTSACVRGEAAKAALLAADLLLLDVKAAQEERHLSLFSFPLGDALCALRLREEAGGPVWVRHVVAPGIADVRAEIGRLGPLLSPFSCVKRVELLPFRSLCLEKYDQMGIPFAMRGAQEPTEEEMARLRKELAGLLPGVEVR